MIERIFLLLLISLFHPSSFSHPIPGPDIVTPKSADNLIHQREEKVSVDDDEDSISSMEEELYSPKHELHHKLRAVSSSSDAIIFPSSTSYVESYDVPFSDRYNVHRPNIPVPERPIPFNFGNSGAPSPKWPVNPNARPFEPETDDVQQQQQLVHLSLQKLLFGRILFDPSNSVSNYFREYQSPAYLRPRGKKIDTSSVQFNFNDNDDEATTVSTIQDFPVSEGLKYQSLYSGPRVQRLPCSKGKYKTHGGRCNDKSSKLIFINDIIEKH